MNVDPDQLNPDKEIGSFMLNASPEPVVPEVVNTVPNVYPGYMIRRGEMNSPAVRRIQTVLNDLGYGPLVVDGDFGEATENAVMFFQARNVDNNEEALDVDGIVGALTWSALFGAETLYDVTNYDAQSSFRELVVQIARSQVGVMESPLGSNRGPQVDQYIRAAGLDPNGASYPWCVAFLQWVFVEASRIRGEASPLPVTAGVYALWNLSLKSNAQVTQIIRPVDVSSQSVMEGMIFLFDTGGGKGHAGLVLEVNAERLVTVEGNTNTAGSRNGVGVFIRQSRMIKMSKLLGYVDYC